MKEDLSEEKDDFFEKDKEFKEDFDREFEPTDEIVEHEYPFEIFEPSDEIYDVDKIFINQFEPSEIKSRKIDPKREPIHKIQPQQALPKIAKNQIERIPTSQPKTFVNPEVNQLSVEQIDKK